MSEGGRASLAHKAIYFFLVSVHVENASTVHGLIGKKYAHSGQNNAKRFPYLPVRCRTMKCKQQGFRFVLPSPYNYE